MYFRDCGPGDVARARRVLEPRAQQRRVLVAAARERGAPALREVAAAAHEPLGDAVRVDERDAVLEVARQDAEAERAELAARLAMEERSPIKILVDRAIDARLTH